MRTARAARATCGGVRRGLVGGVCRGLACFIVRLFPDRGHQQEQEVHAREPAALAAAP